MAPPDPFLQVQSDVLHALTQTRPLLQSYLRIRTTPALPATNPELLSARHELEGALAALSDDVADLVASVAAVDEDPARFGLSSGEVERRHALVRDVGREVEEMRAQVEAGVESAAAAGGGGGGRAAVLPDPARFADVGDGDEDEDPDSYAQFEAQRQQELLHEQDVALDGVFRTVGNLRQQADDMGRELEEQGELLDQVDGLADRVGGKLQNGLKRIGVVVRQNEDSMSSCCIAVLIFVLIILLVLVLIA